MYYSKMVKDTEDTGQDSGQDLGQLGQENIDSARLISAGMAPDKLYPYVKGSDNVQSLCYDSCRITSESSLLKNTAVSNKTVPGTMQYCQRTTAPRISTEINVLSILAFILNHLKVLMLSKWITPPKHHMIIFVLVAMVTVMLPVARCQTDIDECESTPCWNNGTCEDQVNGYICNCTENYVGDNCEYDVSTTLCNPVQYILPGSVTSSVFISCTVCVRHCDALWTEKKI